MRHLPAFGIVVVPNSGQTGSFSFLIFRQLNLTTGQDDRAKHGHGEDHSGQFQRDGKGFNQCHANPAYVVFNGQPSQLALEASDPLVSLSRRPSSSPQWKCIAVVSIHALSVLRGSST